MKPIVTRIAPSPTAQFLHIGNLRTLLYNYFLAKGGPKGSKFLVRLEDTDRDRYNPDFLSYFKDTCDWLGIKPDYSYWNPDTSIGSFIQSERDYSKHLKYLIDNGFAYYAFDTKDELDILKSKGLKYDSTTRMSMKNSLTLNGSDLNDAFKTPYIVRFLVPSNIDVSFTDEILGDITINTNTLDDKVLLKSNGVGSYHLCNVCDDHDMGVTHVLRGNEWIPSTPFHILLYKAFNWDLPKFAHLPLIMNPDGKGKLSKRTASKYGIPIAPIGHIDSDKYVNGWKDLGYDSNAFINALSLINWNTGNDKEIMSVDEMINLFSLDRVHKSSARFDMAKARWINSQYLKRTPNNDLRKFIKFKDDRYSDSKLDLIISIAKDRCDFKYELNNIIDIFYDKPVIDDYSKIDYNFISVMNKFISNFDKIDFDNFDSIRNNLQLICDSLSIKIGKVMPGLRTALVNVPGPDLITTMYILGKDETKIRINYVLKHESEKII